jgi:hypothetical protein
MSDRAAEYIKRFQRADEKRANWKSTWQKIGDYGYTLRGDIQTERFDGTPRHTLVYDGTMEESSNILLAGLFSHMTSPYMPWFKMVPVNQELMDDEEAMLWMQDSEERMYRMFSRCNFYNAIAMLYGDLININHGIMFIGENKNEREIVFTNISPRDCPIFENNNHKIDTIMRKIKYTARQAYQEWGEKCGPEVMKVLNDKPDQIFDFMHVIEPRKDYSRWKKNSLNLPFASVYLSVKDREIIDEGGYPEFPVVAPRWSTYTDDVYGSCPSISALNDVKTLNKAMELLIMVGEKQLNPPLQLTPGFKDRIKTMPGGINIKARKDDEIKAVSDTGKIEITDKLIERLQDSVRKKYFVDVFLMLAQRDQRMTAYEVSQRENEGMMMLGPTLGRLTDECLSPLVYRCWGLMERGGYFLPPPPSIMDEELEVEYLSPLARAQKAVQATSIDRLVAFMAPLAQLYPEISDNLDPDKAIRVYGDVFGVPKTVMRGVDAIEKMRASRAKMNEQEVMRQQMLEATQGLKNIGEADRAATGDKSVLAQLMGQ